MRAWWLCLLLSSWGSSVAAPNRGPPCNGGAVQLSSGSCIFLYVTLDADDSSHMALFPHFMDHYSSLGLPPESFLVLIHVRWYSRYGRAVAQAQGQILHSTWGLRHIRYLEDSALGRDSPRAFVTSIWKLLREFARPHDWVIHADLDEFIGFPGVGGTSSRSVPSYFESLDGEDVNALYGLLLDRVSANGSFNAIQPRASGGSIFQQFPNNCLLTTLSRGADMRKVVAYKGVFRTDIGHHVLLGVSPDYNQTHFSYSAWRGKADHPAHELKRLWRSATVLHSRSQRVMGRDLYDLAPFSRMRALPRIKATVDIASVFHFKWNNGLVKRARIEEAHGWNLGAWNQKMPKSIPTAQSCLLFTEKEVPGSPTRPLSPGEILSLLRGRDDHDSDADGQRYQLFLFYRNYFQYNVDAALFLMGGLP